MSITDKKTIKSQNNENNNELLAKLSDNYYSRAETTEFESLDLARGAHVVLLSLLIKIWKIDIFLIMVKKGHLNDFYIYI